MIDLLHACHNEAEAEAYIDLVAGDYAPFKTIGCALWALELCRREKEAKNDQPLR